MGRKAVFIDRDGTLVEAVVEDGIPRAPFRREEFRLLPNVEDGLAILKDLGFLRILVTNQPDVAYGYLTEKEWRGIQDRVEELGFDDVYICRHRLLDKCRCKKPNPGMLLDAAKKWDIDLTASYMIGDTVSDIGAAINAGVKIILIRAPYNKMVRAFDYEARDFLHATLTIKILERTERRTK